MKRTCNGGDPFLLGKDGKLPCACGKTFDDVRYTTVWPHRYIPTRRERVFNLIENRDVALAALNEAYPGIDWKLWLYEQAAEVGLLDALPPEILGTALNDAPAGGEVEVRVDGPVFHGPVSGNIAWGNGSVVQNGGGSGDR